ncbi:hypothetical protein L6164_013431 [Bauhinia variegata]|uniref:Uncharacterized protein n=1 Tax=Bauhinia variegata TaxID=167791 RepID=A0ACB9NFV9_BAUVA|nr:hypothetical protein L6164_013431 [Bauhinia variegata]
MQSSLLAKHISFISDLSPSKHEWNIRARVIRLWKQPNFLCPELGDNVESVLLDEKCGRIQATARGTLRIKDQLVEGNVHEIFTFGMVLNSQPYKTTMHNYKLTFNLKMTLTLVPTSTIPMYGFSFVNFEDILNEAKEDAYLVVGTLINQMACVMETGWLLLKWVTMLLKQRFSQVNNIGQVVLIPTMTKYPSNQTLPIKFQRRQFPLLSWFAMTINKSQGKTLSHVERATLRGPYKS